MQFGVTLPHFGPLATREAVSVVAHRADELGFDLGIVSDHIVIPSRIETRYPYGGGAPFPIEDTENFLEPLTVLAFVAGGTSDIRLGMSVLVAPYRNPLLAAKMISTLDVMSNGRIIVGVGSGWMAEEFDRLGVPFEHREEMTDEWVRLWKVLWTEEAPSFRGRFVQFEAARFFPKPVQKPHPPIWVGGHSRRALRRALELGDGWHAVGLEPGRLANRLEVLRKLAVQMDRSLDGFQISCRYQLDLRGSNGQFAEKAQEQKLFSGEPGEIIEKAHRIEELGVNSLVFDLQSHDLRGVVEMMELFASEVRPAFHSG